MWTNLPKSVCPWVPTFSIYSYVCERSHRTVDFLFDWFGISCMTTDHFCFYFQNRLLQTSQTGGQWYSDTSPLVFPGFTLGNIFSLVLYWPISLRNLPADIVVERKYFQGKNALAYFSGALATDRKGLPDRRQGVTVETSYRLDDNQWHSVLVERNRKEAMVVVDGARDQFYKTFSVRDIRIFVIS